MIQPAPAERTPEDLDCERARAEISARLDGERFDAATLDAHLTTCSACRAHERALGALAPTFAALRHPEPLNDLWPAIERRAGRLRHAPLLTRVAAALVGFVGLGATALLVDREDRTPEPRRHLLERLAAGAPAPDALLEALPEYRLLRALPREETR